MKHAAYYDNMKTTKGLHFETQAVRGVAGNDQHTGAISFPIYQTAIYEHFSIENAEPYNYSRCVNPTREELERTMCLLDNGNRAFAVSSGMAALCLAFSLLKSGDHIIFSDDVYGGSIRLMDGYLEKFGVTFDSIDLRDLDLLERTITPQTQLILLESPTNPMMKVPSITAVCQVAHSHGVQVIVDNTFLTPYYQRPLDLGADMVVYSGTKYLAGHNDTMCGILVVKDHALGEALEIQTYISGAALAPQDAWLVIRGLKTLPLRMDRHELNTNRVAHWLRSHPKVKKVYYIGFADHPDYAVSQQQATGSGSVLSFELESCEAANHLLSNLKLIYFAESLGGVESLITHPVTRTHTEVSLEARERLGLTDALLRMSVGIEHIDDLLADLEQALSDL